MLQMFVRAAILPAVGHLVVRVLPWEPGPVIDPAQPAKLILDAGDGAIETERHLRVNGIRHDGEQDGSALAGSSIAAVRSAVHRQVDKVADRGCEVIPCLCLRRPEAFRRPASPGLGRRLLHPPQASRWS